MMVSVYRLLLVLCLSQPYPCFAQLVDSVKALHEAQKEFDKKLQEIDKANVKNEASVQSLKDIQNVVFASLGIIVTIVIAFSIFNIIDIRNKLAGFEKEKKEVLEQASRELHTKAEEELQKLATIREQALAVFESLTTGMDNAPPSNNPQSHDNPSNAG